MRRLLSHFGLLATAVLLNVAGPARAQVDPDAVFREFKYEMYYSAGSSALLPNSGIFTDLLDEGYALDFNIRKPWGPREAMGYRGFRRFDWNYGASYRAFDATDDVFLRQVDGGAVAGDFQLADLNLYLFQTGPGLTIYHPVGVADNAVTLDLRLDGIVGGAQASFAPAMPAADAAPFVITTRPLKDAIIYGTEIGAKAAYIFSGGASLFLRAGYGALKTEAVTGAEHGSTYFSIGAGIEFPFPGSQKP